MNGHSTSAYINRPNIHQLIRDNEDLIIIAAGTGKNITRSILIQIILDYETKGYESLPVNFLKHLIRFYGEVGKGIAARFTENLKQDFRTSS